MNSYVTFRDLWIHLWIHVYEEYREIIPEFRCTKVPDDQSRERAIKRAAREKIVSKPFIVHLNCFCFLMNNLSNAQFPAAAPLSRAGRTRGFVQIYSIHDTPEQQHKDSTTFQVMEFSIGNNGKPPVLGSEALRGLGYWLDAHVTTACRRQGPNPGLPRLESNPGLPRLES